MRRIVPLAALVAICISALVPAAVGAMPPTPTMDITACRVDGDTVRVGVTWSHPNDITLEQRVIGEGNIAEEILAC